MDRETSILVTGGTGFFGTALCDKLTELGYTNLTAVGSCVYDLEIQSATYRMLLETKPDIVFHLAAMSGGIGVNRSAPADFWYTNSIMGLNIIHACAIAEISKLIIVGTTCSYPKFCQVPFKEDRIWDGFPEETNAPYGIAKKNLMIGAKAYEDQYHMNIICPVFTNLYGPRDNFDLESSHVIPAMIRKMHEAKITYSNKVVLWGDGSPSRDLLHIEDAACALIECAKNNKLTSEPINFGSGMEIQMTRLADIVKNVVGYEGEIHWDLSKPNGQPRRVLDISKAKELLGWEPKKDLISSLEDLYKWFVRTYNGSDEDY